MTRRRPGRAPRPVMSDAHRGAITTELVRLSIGARGPQRPELEAPPGWVANIPKPTRSCPEAS